MRMGESLIRRLDARCLPCFALERERAQVAPHEMLQLVASVATATGVREEFTCGTCGQRMVRFLAKQTNPPPSNVWRTERFSAQAAPAVAAPPVLPVEDPTEDPLFEPDLEAGTPDEAEALDEVDSLGEAHPILPVRSESESSYSPPEL